MVVRVCDKGEVGDGKRVLMLREREIVKEQRREDREKGENREKKEEEKKKTKCHRSAKTRTWQSSTAKPRLDEPQSNSRAKHRQNAACKE